MIRLGERLKSKRAELGLSIEDASDATKIRPEYLRAIEAGNYGALPSRTYAQGFVSNYISYLGLPRRDTMAVFRREFDEKEFNGVLPSRFVERKSMIPGFRIGPVGIFVIFAIVAIVSFFLFQYRDALFDPSLSVSSPVDGAVVHTGVITVVGKASPGALVSIDGDAALTDKNGAFSKETGLFTGEQTIVVMAKNSYGRTTTLFRRVKVD